MPTKRQKMATAHQRKTWKESRDRDLLNYGTGSGKTLCALGLCFNKVESALVVVPLSVFNKWVGEIKMWGEDFELIEEHDRYQIVQSEGVKFFIVTKEWFRDNLNDMPGMEALIIDEAHHFSGMKSKMSKAAIKYAKHWEVKYRYLLTATAYRSTPWNIYRLAKILGHDWSYPSFERKYFKPQYFGKRRVMTPKSGIESDIAELVGQIGRVYDPSEDMDLPEQIDQVEKVPLTSEQEKAMEDTALENLNPIVRYTKHHCIESGWLSGDEYVEARTFNNHKIDRIQEYAEEKNKVAVVARYTDQLHYIEEKLKVKKPIFKIWGGDKDREDIIKKVQDAEECVVLISAGVSEGYELPDISLCVFASMSFSYTDYKQVRGRFLRMNKPSRTVFVHLLSKRDGDEESIDEAVYNSVVNKKQKFDIEIYAQNREM